MLYCSSDFIMKTVMVIPSYWSREKSVGWKKQDAIYDHPTPIDQEGTLARTLESLKIIKNKFKESGIDYEYLDGSTRNRMERVRHFNNDESTKVFLISLKAGGTGLNLTSADIVIHVDPWWNPMVERQASDRAHRIGQDKRVMVYKLITRGTVEEKMLKLQKKKENIFDKVIEDNPNPIDSITWEDIQELLNYN